MAVCVVECTISRKEGTVVVCNNSTCYLIDISKINRLPVAKGKSFTSFKLCDYSKLWQEFYKIIGKLFVAILGVIDEIGVKGKTRSKSENSRSDPISKSGVKVGKIVLRIVGQLRICYKLKTI